jgi:hypothetical protein
LLLICGTFEITHEGKPSAFPFVQVRTKQADKWLLTSVQVFAVGG